MVCDCGLFLLYSPEFLLSELMAARLIDLRRRKSPEMMETDQEPSYSVPANLTAILKAYGLSMPPAHITTHQLFDKLISKVTCCDSQQFVFSLVHIIPL